MNLAQKVKQKLSQLQLLVKKQDWTVCLTLKGNQRKDLKYFFNRWLIVIAFILTESASKISNYNTKNADDAWVLFCTILIINMVLILFAFRQYGYKLLGGTTYRIIMYVLANNAFDKYFGIKGYSWNDLLTIVVIFLDFLLQKYISKKFFKLNINKNDSR